MKKGSIQEKGITLVKIYTPSIRAPKYTKQILTDVKGETDSNTIIVGGINTPLSSMDRSSRQKISKATEVANDTIDHFDLIDTYRTLHPPKKCRIHILLKCTRNVLQDRSHTRLQNKPQQI